MSFIPEKINSIERALIAAASMAPSDARNVLRLICEGGMTTTVALNEPSEGDKHYAKRAKFIKRMKSSTDRVCGYARHETLRNIEKHFRENPQHIKSAEGEAESKPSSLAARLTFDRSSFSEELLAALAEDQAAALQTSGQQLFDEIGKDSVWRLPSQDATQFLEDRANLLANVPDEIHTEIMQSIEQGLAGGESRRQLMARISTAFDEIGKSRAETIANTETAAAFNYARDKAMREAGVTHKRWLHSQSPLIQEPRPTHVEADGQVMPIDEPFDIGGVLMMHPGDESARPEEVINCHCVAIPVEAPIESGESEGHPFRGNQYTKFYHGSPQSFEEFDPKKRESAKGSSGGMIWLTSRPEEAQAIAEFAPTTGDRTATVKAFSHNLKNPLIVDMKGERLSPNDRYKAIEKAKSGGHDGIIFRNIDIIAGGKRSDYLAVFDTKHLKSE